MVNVPSEQVVIAICNLVATIFTYLRVRSVRSESRAQHEQTRGKVEEATKAANAAYVEANNVNEKIAAMNGR